MVGFPSSSVRYAQSQTSCQDSCTTLTPSRILGLVLPGTVPLLVLTMMPPGFFLRLGR